MEQVPLYEEIVYIYIYIYTQTGEQVVGFGIIGARDLGIIYASFVRTKITRIALLKKDTFFVPTTS